MPMVAPKKIENNLNFTGYHVILTVNEKEIVANFTQRQNMQKYGWH